MAITYFGAASNPADNGTSTATTIAVTPPASMQAGDLVLLIGHQRGTATISVSQARGQTWNDLGSNNGTNVSTRVFWCRFNGTWTGGNPALGFSAGTCTSAQMLVYRPTNSAYTWELDNYATSSFTAGSSPFTKTVNDQDTSRTSTVAIAGWFSTDDNTWGSLSGSGWVNAGSTQYRNASGSQQSSTYAHKIRTAAGTFVNVSKNQATNGGDAGRTWWLSFAEVPPDPDIPVLNNPADGSTGSDTTPTVEFTGTEVVGNDLRYNVQIAKEGFGNTLAWQPSESFGSQVRVANGTISQIANSFTPSSTGKLESIDVFLSTFGTITGTVTAKLYSHTGTFGTSSAPLTLLATGETVDVTKLVQGGNAWRRFYFPSGQQYTLQQGTNYVFVLDATNVTADASNWLGCPTDITTDVLGGNRASYQGGAWGDFSAFDISFRVNESGFQRHELTQSSGALDFTMGGSWKGWGQIIKTTNGGTLKSITFSLNKVGSPSGNNQARVYAVTSGELWDSSPVIGSLLATSDNIASSSISTSQSDVQFNFSGGQQITLAPNTMYLLVSYITSSDVSNYTNTYANNTAIPSNRAMGCSLRTSDGVNFIIGSFSNPLRFRLEKDDFLILDKVSGTDSGFVNTVNGGDTDPFTQNQKVSFTVQAGDALPAGDYVWRVRSIAPSGTNNYTDWSNSRLFNINNNITTPQTQTGVSRIQSTTTKTQSGVSRISVTTSRTQTGKSRITASAQRTQTGVARLSKTITSTQTGKGRITASSIQTQTGKARIQTPPTVSLVTGDNSVFTDTTPSLEFVGTDANGDALQYEIEVRKELVVGRFIPDTGTTFTKFLDSAGGTLKGVGQGFTASQNATLTFAEFVIWRAGTISGNAVAKIYNYTGTFDTNETPTGAPLATSDLLDVSAISNSATLTRFTFSGVNQIALNAATNYIVAIEFLGTATGGNALGVDHVSVGYTPSHAGVLSTYNGSSWTAISTQEMPFSVLGYEVTLTKDSALDTGFIDVTSSSTNPFTSGNSIQYTVQSALSVGKYFWRVRGKDPSGSNTFGDWTSFREFFIQITSSTTQTGKAFIQKIPTANLITADGHNFGLDTTPTLRFAGYDENFDDLHYQIQISKNNAFLPAELVNVPTSNPSGGGFVTISGYGQTFEGSNDSIGKIGVYMDRSITGTTETFQIEIYAHTGTYGSSGNGTGAVLATSNTVNINTLPTTMGLVEFTFPTPFVMSAGTNYVFIVRANQFFANGLHARIFFNLANNYSGNFVYNAPTGSGTGTPFAPYDAPFVIYADRLPSDFVLDRNTVDHAGQFYNTYDGLDTPPFVAYDPIDFTVQGADALTTGTYYWRVRAIDPSGSNTWSDWASYRSFTINETSVRTQTGISRVQKSITQTQVGVSRIYNTTTRTQVGKARIRKSFVYTQTGLSRIQKSVTRNQLGVSSIRNTTVRTQTGVSRVTSGTIVAIIGKASVRNTSQRIQTGVARIVKSNQFTQTGLSRIQKSVTATQNGLSRIQKTTQISILGKANIKNTTTRIQVGVSRIVTNSFATITGVASVRNTTVVVQVGISRVQGITTRTQVGKALIAPENPYLTDVLSSELILNGITNSELTVQALTDSDIIHKGLLESVLVDSGKNNSEIQSEGKMESELTSNGETNSEINDGVLISFIREP